MISAISITFPSFEKPSEFNVTPPPHTHTGAGVTDDSESAVRLVDTTSPVVPKAGAMNVFLASSWASIGREIDTVIQKQEIAKRGLEEARDVMRSGFYPEVLGKKVFFKNSSQAIENYEKAIKLIDSMLAQLKELQQEIPGVNPHNLEEKAEVLLTACTQCNMLFREFNTFKNGLLHIESRCLFNKIGPVLRPLYEVVYLTASYFGHLIANIIDLLPSIFPEKSKARFYDHEFIRNTMSQLMQDFDKGKKMFDAQLLTQAVQSSRHAIEVSTENTQLRQQVEELSGEVGQLRRQLEESVKALTDGQDRILRILEHLETAKVTTEDSSGTANDPRQRTFA